LVSCRQIDGIAPTFSKKPSIRQEEDGKRLLFECRIQADPKPTVSWSHSGTPVKDDARHKVSQIQLCVFLFFGGILKIKWVFNLEVQRIPTIWRKKTTNNSFLLICLLTKPMFSL